MSTSLWAAHYIHYIKAKEIINFAMIRQVGFDEIAVALGIGIGIVVVHQGVWSITIPVPCSFGSRVLRAVVRIVTQFPDAAGTAELCRIA